jgi:hypothetical protein
MRAARAGSSQELNICWLSEVAARVADLIIVYRKANNPPIIKLLLANGGRLAGAWANIAAPRINLVKCAVFQ